ncbi:hypothetical protein DFP72DRAFT_1052311 [Ephemerocybe angulata]|uniref:Uncharacterized protein n=1 Tax=Ephemerocybe angulata TaxID=980116 RepID=A0A8H6HBP2_9AGAR|nr:hypothetical protein DFP72DRAFT_1052311 [Tulosesus angulatus]
MHSWESSGGCRTGGICRRVFGRNRHLSPSSHPTFIASIHPGPLTSERPLMEDPPSLTVYLTYAGRSRKQSCTTVPYLIHRLSTLLLGMGSPWSRRGWNWDKCGRGLTQLLAELVPKYLDPPAYGVALGGVPAITKILELKWRCTHLLWTQATPASPGGEASHAYDPRRESPLISASWMVAANLGQEELRTCGGDEAMLDSSSVFEMEWGGVQFVCALVRPMSAGPRSFQPSPYSPEVRVVLFRWVLWFGGGVRRWRRVLDEEQVGKVILSFSRSMVGGRTSLVATDRPFGDPFDVELKSVLLIRDLGAVVRLGLPHLSFVANDGWWV